jgi:tRNA-(ms[2]io[6]A)-hydroxylase
MQPVSASGGPPARVDIGPVIAFLPCRTPVDWVLQAVDRIDELLHDHASLELKAAQQAQRLISRYGAARTRAGRILSDRFRSTLINRMSRLAREELRHFEQVVAIIERRGGRYRAVSPSRYAAGLHELAHSRDPEALVDALLIGAVIEARSCERFFSLIDRAGTGLDPVIAGFYASLLRSEARHFEGYLSLARSAAGSDISGRLDVFLARDRELVETPDTELRFLSGPPPAAVRANAGAV